MPSIINRGSGVVVNTTDIILKTLIQTDMLQIYGEELPLKIDHFMTHVRDAIPSKRHEDEKRPQS